MCFTIRTSVASFSTPPTSSTSPALATTQIGGEKGKRGGGEEFAGFRGMVVGDDRLAVGGELLCTICQSQWAVLSSY